MPSGKLAKGPLGDEYRSLLVAGWGCSAEWELMSSALVDVERLAVWLDAQGLKVGEPIAVEPLAGGSSNAMFVVERGSGRWVLRRPARVAVDRANEGMRREFRLLKGLEGTPVPHPGPVALCEDQTVLGCVFYVMQQVHGVHPVPPPEALDDEVHRREIAFALIDGLAWLHQVDWRAAGLSDLGRPEQFHERQVSRWTRQLASYGGRELTGIDEVTDWLGKHLPTSFEPTIMHGDYHMLNVLIAPDAPTRMVAILDWETATIGDPLLDLAGFCEVWFTSAKEGWPTRQEFIARYSEVRQLEVPPDLTYYEVLYNFRLAVLLEGIYQRSLVDPNRETQDALGERVLFNLARAQQLVRGS
jgi:aminoglycoside phosphotransferase (APT) family kinase protein